MFSLHLCEGIGFRFDWDVVLEVNGMVEFSMWREGNVVGFGEDVRVDCSVVWGVIRATLIEGWHVNVALFFYRDFANRSVAGSFLAAREFDFSCSPVNLRIVQLVPVHAEVQRTVRA